MPAKEGEFMEKRLDVACVGILVADAIGRTIDGIPERGKLQLVDRIDLFVGGCASNAGIDLAKIGLSVGVLGKIGDDGFGRFISDSLVKEGVDVTGLVSDPAFGTSASLVLVDGSGERTFLHCYGANAEYHLSDVRMDVIERSKLLFIAGTMLLPGFDGAPAAELLEKASRMGVVTVLDTAWDSKGRWMHILSPCLPHLDYFLPSYEEAVQLSGLEDPERIARFFLDRGVRKAVAVKLGKDGCLVADRAGLVARIPTYASAKVVETTGAGDAFCAGFTAGLSKGWDLLECARFANATGTFCVTAAGATTGMRPLAEIQAFMAAHPDENRPQVLSRGAAK
jgi:sugar/nucleoside kinase (ribokinase family)